MINLTTFPHSDLRLLWESFKEGYNKQQLMALMGYDEKQFAEAYHQARKEFGKVIPAPRQKPLVVQLKHTRRPIPINKTTFKRPKHENSVKSPYGIARPGIIKQ